MAITEDASAPANKTWTGAWTTAQTTAAFSPPANVLLLALLVGSGANSAAITGSITDSLSGSWTLLKRENTFSTSTPGVGGTVEIWCKYQSSSQTNMTVSATGTGTGLAGGMLSVLVLNGAGSTQAGVVGSASGNSPTASAPTVTITPGAAGNRAYGVVQNYTDQNALTVNAQTTAGSLFSDTTNGDWYSAWKSSSTTVASSTVFGYSTTKQSWLIAVAEIQVAAGGGATATPSPVVSAAAVQRAASW